MNTATRIIPCFVTSTQARVLFRDICRRVNFYSPNKSSDIVISTPDGIEGHGGGWLPEWIRSIEVSKNSEALRVRLVAEPGVAAEAVDALASEVVEELSQMFSHLVRQVPKRVFCIGWSKTGTSSIIEALRLLGFFSWHFAPWVIGISHFSGDLSQTRVDLREIEEYSAVADLPICALFRELDKNFPESLFLLTVRDTEKWVSSALAAAECNRDFCGSPDSIYRWAYGAPIIDRSVFQNRYLQHNREVREYFGKRPDFLEIDVTSGNPWPKLGAFLKMPVPDVSFPHTNRRKGR